MYRPEDFLSVKNHAPVNTVLFDAVFGDIGDSYEIGGEEIGANGEQDNQQGENELSPIMDAEGWREGIHCPISLPGFNTQTAVLAIARKPCGGWPCRDCSVSRATEFLSHASQQFRTSGPVWWSMFDYAGSKTLAAVRQRRKRNYQAPAAWVQRGDVLHVFSPADLSGVGMQLPGLWLPADSAIAVLRRKALKLPGVDAARFVGDWKPPSKPKETSNFSAPLGATSSRAAEWVLEELMNNHPDLPLVGDGAQVNLEQWKEEFNAAYEGYKNWKDWDV